MTFAHLTHRQAIVCSIVALFLQTGSAQLVTLDMTTKKVSGLTTLNGLEKGQAYQVAVTNVNLNLYRVKVNAEDSSTATALTFPSFTSVATDAISKLAGGIGVTSSAGALAFIPLLDNGLESFTMNKGTLDSKTRSFMAQRTKPVMQDPHRNFLVKQFHDRSIRIALHSAKLVAIKGEIDNEAMKVLKRGYELQKLVPAGAGVDVVDACLLAMQNLRLQLLTEQAEIVQVQHDFAVMLSDPRSVELFEKEKALKADADKVTNGLAALATNASEQLTAINAENLGKLLNPIHVMEQNKVGTYTSVEQMYGGGKGTITIGVEPVSKDGVLPSYITKLNFPAPDHWYWGVSAGMFGSNLYSDAFGTVTYDLITPVDTLKAYYLVEEDVTRKEIGVNALFTVGKKVEGLNSLGIHMVLGPGVGIAEKIRPRALLGVGLSFGKDHMVTLDFGAVAGWVDRRGAAFSGQEPLLAPADKPTVVAKLESSLFFSLGYLFWKG